MNAVVTEGCGVVNDLVTIPERLNLLLEDRGLSQSELARRSGYKQPQVNLWVNGKSRLFADQAIKLCQALSVSADWLLDEEADDKIPAEPSPWEVRVMEIVREIGPERAWRRLVGSEDASRFVTYDTGPEPPPAKRGTA